MDTDVALQRTLVELNDNLSETDCVELVSLQPHVSARDSFIARVKVLKSDWELTVRLLSEQIYQTTGSLVLFRPALD